MWTQLLKTCLSALVDYWREALIISLLCASWYLNSRLESVKAEFEQAKLDWQEQVRQAQAATDQQKKEYDDAFQLGSTQVARMVAAVEETAWENFKKKYPPVRCPAGGTGPVGVRPVPEAPATRTSAPESPGRTNEASGEQLVDRAFVDSCGRDALRLNTWIEICKVAKCEIVK